MYKARIKKGIELLNEYHGGAENWIFKVDPATLELESSNMCVLGQVYFSEGKDTRPWPISGYEIGINQLNIPFSESNYGFDVVGCDHTWREKGHCFHCTAPTEKQYSMLTEEWIHEIKELINSL